MDRNIGMKQIVAEAQQRLSIRKLPMILALHLERYKYVLHVHQTILLGGPPAGTAALQCLQ